MSTREAAPHLRSVRPDETLRPGTTGRPGSVPAGERSFEVIEHRRQLATRVARYLGGLALITLLVALVGALAFHATIVQTQQGLDEKNDRIEELEATTKRLRQELAELAAPARVVSEAKELGMIEAPSIVYLNAPSNELDDRTLTVARNQLEGSG